MTVGVQQAGKPVTKSNLSLCAAAQVAAVSVPWWIAGGRFALPHGIGHSGCVAVVMSLDVLPLHAQVVLLDGTWQDYPDWGDGSGQVASRPIAD
jgi:hypothetical protein